MTPPHHWASEMKEMGQVLPREGNWKAELSTAVISGSKLETCKKKTS